MVALLLLAGLAAFSSPVSPAEGESADSRSRLVSGEVLRTDVGRQVLVVRVGGREPREMEIATDEATRFTAGGRAVRLEDVRAGDRVTASCAPSGGDRCLARLVRAGGGRAAVPVPSAAPARP